MESYTKLHKDWLRTIEQDAPIGISKQHTNSKRKLKKTARQYGTDEQQGIKKNTKLKSK